MKELMLFENKEFGKVRSVLIDNEPYFVGKDVATILGYANHRKAIIDHVDEEDKNDGVTIRDSIGREQKPILINESGLYGLILSSKLPKAKEFKHWVTSEVLPSIRKHGMYATEELIENPDLLISVATKLKEEKEKTKKLNDKVALQRQQINELSPKASYYDVVLNCKDLVSTSTISKHYGWSAKKLNDYLHEKGVQYKQGNIWLLYQKYSENGYTSTKTHTYLSDNEQHTKVHTYWTQKGRLFIYSLLKEDGILPLIEREENKN